MISLLTNETLNEEEMKNRIKYNYKTSKKIKLDKENLLSYNNMPIQIDESYVFDLNSKTNYLNLFLWTNQYIAKTGKVKNLLIGYVKNI